MLLTEYDEKKHMKDTYREGFDDGEKAGFDKGEKAGFDKGERVGFDKGERAGFDKGERVGFDKGQHDVLEKINGMLASGKSIDVIVKELEEEMEISNKK